MPALTYVVIKGRVSREKLSPLNRREKPHEHVLIIGGNKSFDAAVNVVSEDSGYNSAVLFAEVDGFAPSQADALLALGDGLTVLPADSSLRLDYVADDLIARDRMAALPRTTPPRTRRGRRR